MDKLAPQTNPPGSEGAEGRLEAGLLATAFSTVTRLLPHTWNFTALGAAEVFAGAKLPLWTALGLSLIIRVLTDIGRYLIEGGKADSWLYLSFLPWVYSGLAVNVLLGKLVKNRSRPMAILGVTTASAVSFFLITNFGSWIGSNMYPRTAAGLLQSFEMGLPFLRNNLYANWLYGASIFGIHAWLWRRQPALEPNRS